MFTIFKSYLDKLTKWFLFITFQKHFILYTFPKTYILTNLSILSAFSISFIKSHFLHAMLKIISSKVFEGKYSKFAVVFPCSCNINSDIKTRECHCRNIWITTRIFPCCNISIYISTIIEYRSLHKGISFTCRIDIYESPL